MTVQLGALSLFYSCPVRSLKLYSTRGLIWPLSLSLLVMTVPRGQHPSRNLIGLVPCGDLGELQGKLVATLEIVVIWPTIACIHLLSANAKGVLLHIDAGPVVWRCSACFMSNVWRWKLLWSSCRKSVVLVGWSLHEYVGYRRQFRTCLLLWFKVATWTLGNTSIALRCDSLGSCFTSEGTHKFDEESCMLFFVNLVLNAWRIVL